MKSALLDVKEEIREIQEAILNTKSELHKTGELLNLLRDYMNENHIIIHLREIL